MQTDNLFSIASHPGIFQTNLLLFIRELCTCLQPFLISSTTLGEELDFTTANHIKDINLLWTYIIRNDWKHLLKTEISQKKNIF